ncbi:Uncharacterised protein [Candidatus Tiddalikarchaeum anstoanum]|nr:Uncharacterised protein [Candidatus Tiddalikarchaeum anstoanum]
MFEIIEYQKAPLADCFKPFNFLEKILNQFDPLFLKYMEKKIQYNQLFVYHLSEAFKEDLITFDYKKIKKEYNQILTNMTPEEKEKHLNFVKLIKEKYDLRN